MPPAAMTGREPQMKPGLRQGKFVTNTNKLLGEARDTLNKFMYRNDPKLEAATVTGSELLRCRAQGRRRTVEADQLQGRVTKVVLHQIVAITVMGWLAELSRNDQAVPETEWVKGSQSTENMWILAAFKVEYLENGKTIQYAVPTIATGHTMKLDGAGHPSVHAVPPDVQRGQQGALKNLVSQQDTADEAEDSVDCILITCAFVDIAGSDWGKRHRQARGNELKKQYADSQDNARLLLREQHSTEGGYSLLPSELPRAVRLVANVRRPERVIGPDQVVSLLGSRYDYATIEKDADRYSAEQAQETSAIDQTVIAQVTALIDCGENDEAIAKALTGVPQSLVAKIRADVAKPEAEAEPAKKPRKTAKDQQ